MRRNPHFYIKDKVNMNYRERMHLASQQATLALVHFRKVSKKLPYCTLIFWIRNFVIPFSIRYCTKTTKQFFFFSCFLSIGGKPLLILQYHIHNITYTTSSYMLHTNNSASTIQFNNSPNISSHNPTHYTIHSTNTKSCLETACSYGATADSPRTTKSPMLEKVPMESTATEIFGTRVISFVAGV